MKISDFVGKISSGLARSNRFLINLTPPSSIIQSVNGQANFSGYANFQKILLLCDSAQLPGVNLNSTPIRSFGEVREIPYEINYEPITLTFYVDAQMNVKKLFDAWLAATQIGESRKFAYYDSYITKMSIYVQDMQEENRYIVDLYEAYPKTVSAVQVDYANRDVMKLSVTMMYKYWRSSQVSYAGSIQLSNRDIFDYTSNVDIEQYNNNFMDFQQRYNIDYGTPESLENYTGETITYI